MCIVHIRKKKGDMKLFFNMGKPHQLMGEKTGILNININVGGGHNYYHYVHHLILLRSPKKLVVI